MRARGAVAVGLSLPLLWLGVEACSGDDASVDDTTDAAIPDATFDTTGDRSIDDTGVRDASNDAGDANAADANAADANDAGDGAAASDAADADDASDAADAADAFDAAPPPAVRVSPGCPTGIAIAGSTLYWTENAANGCLPTIRACPTTGCASLPPAIYAGISGQSLPIGIAAVAGTPDDLYYADDQFQRASLWRLQGDGGAMTMWGSSTVAASAAITDGTSVFWASGEGVFRSSRTTSGATLIVGTAPDSISPQAVAVDANNVYVATGGVVVACPKTANCTSTGGTTATTIANAAGVQSMWSDGTTLFFTAFATGHDKLYRCPVTGCASATPILFSDTATSAASQQFGTGVMTTDTDVYWGTTSGFVYVCNKSATAPCSPVPWVTGAQPIAMVRDATRLYWSDGRGVYGVGLR